MPTPKQYESDAARKRAWRERKRQAQVAQAKADRQAEAEREHARQAQAERARELTAEIKRAALVLLDFYRSPLANQPTEREAWQRMLDYVERWHGW